MKQLSRTFRNIRGRRSNASNTEMKKIKQEQWDPLLLEAMQNKPGTIHVSLLLGRKGYLPNLTNITIEEEELPRPHFYKMEFSRSQILNSDFSKGFFDKVNFKKARIKKVLFLEGRFQEINFEGTKFENVDFPKSIFYEINFTNIVTNKINFNKSCISHSKFLKAKLSGANFKSSSLRRISFANANLSNADFSETVLIEVDFANANLKGCNFKNAILINVDIEEIPKDAISNFEKFFESSERILSNGPNSKKQLHNYLQVAEYYSKHFSFMNLTKEDVRKLEKLKHDLKEHFPYIIKKKYNNSSWVRRVSELRTLRQFSQKLPYDIIINIGNILLSQESLSDPQKKDLISYSFNRENSEISSKDTIRKKSDMIYKILAETELEKKHAAKLLDKHSLAHEEKFAQGIC